MRRFRKLSVPKHAHPLVRQLFEQMNYQRIGVTDMAERAGLARETFKGWRTKHCPRVADLEACFNVLGKSLKITDLRHD
jgi:hypothetical protein